MNDKTFQNSNTVIISGIKYGDGQQRRFWLTKLRKENTFYHMHKKGQNYCYPFRDYKFREFPSCVINELKKKYPSLTHSGCLICPVLVLFRIKNEKRYESSYNYAKYLNLIDKNGEIIKYKEV